MEDTQQSSKWEVYKDALNPSHLPPQRRTRAWDRAPVPAHAPRIQGKQIWKKAGIRTEADKDKENRENEVEIESLSRGAGARKKQRLANAVGDIREPAWKAVPVVEVIQSDHTNIRAGSLEVAVDLEDNNDASSTPAKRPVYNHILSPKKGANNIPLQTITPNDRTPRKRRSETFRVEIPSHIHDKNVSPVSIEEMTEVEKLPRKRRISNIGRRRKSMRVKSSSSNSTTPKPKRRISTGSISAITEGKELEKGYAFRGSPPEPSAETEVSAFFRTEIESRDDDLFEQEDAYPFDLSMVSDSAEQGDAPSRAGTTLDDILEEPTSFELEMETKRLLAASGEEASTPISDALTGNDSQDTSGTSLLENASGNAMSFDSILQTDTSPSVPEASGTSASPRLHQSLSPATTGFPISVAGDSYAEIMKDIDTETVPTSPRQSSKSLPRNDLNQPVVAEPTPQIVIVPGGEAVAQEAETGQDSLPATNIPQTTNAMSGFPSPALKSAEKPAPSLNSNASPRKKSSQEHKSRPTPQRRGSRRRARNTRSGSFQPASDVERPLQQNASTPTSIEDSVATSETLSGPVEASDEAPEQEAAFKSEPTFLDLTPPRNDHDDQVALEIQILGFSPTKQKESVLNVPSGAESSGSPDVSLLLEDKSAIAATTTSSTQVSPIVAEEKLEVLDAEIASPNSPVNQTIEANEDFDDLSGTPEDLENFEEITLTITDPAEAIDELSEDFQESSTPDPSTTELVETISENAPTSSFDLDETDMLRSFLTRVKANKAAKAVASPKPKRKRSLPHSPIQGSLDSTEKGDSPEEKDDFDVSLPAPSPTKRRKVATNDLETADDRPTRRSARTRLPVKAAPVAAPSFIPIRRLDQEGDSTITLRRNEEKDLAALTRVNTRKNKGGAIHPLELLKKKAEEKEDPAARQRALKEIFDEKAQKQKQGKRRKTVVWAAVLTEFQTADGKTVVAEAEKEIEMPVVEKKVVESSTEDKKVSKLPVEEKKALKVGVRSKIALGMAANGTPAPKRKMRGRS